METKEEKGAEYVVRIDGQGAPPSVPTTSSPPPVPSPSPSPPPPPDAFALPSSSVNPATVSSVLHPSRLPPRLRSDSPYHRVATLYCPECLYLEFPGCLIHNGLLCTQKGNGFMSCTGCEDERKQRGGDTPDSMLSMICATDLSEPWSVACQHCNLVRADTLPWILHDAQSQVLADSIDKEKADCSPISVIQCNQCKTTIFPLVWGYLVHRTEKELLVGRISATSTDEETMNYKISDFPFTHYKQKCTGELVVVPILMSKLEGKFCGQSLPMSPCLPKDETQVSAFLPPLTWITGAVNELKQKNKEHRDSLYALSPHQDKDWKNPVWRDRSYVGEFGDCFVRDTELEGGQLAPSISALAYIGKRVLENRREEWLYEWSDEEIKQASKAVAVLESGTEVANLAKDSVMASVDKDKDEKVKETAMMKVFLVWHEKLWSLPVGGRLVIPGGWMAPKGGHGIMHTIIRNSVEEYSFTVHNTGGGLDYHPSTTAYTPKTKMLTTLSFPRIPRSLMLDDAFWYLFWRLQLVASDDHNQHVIYDILIPHLTKKTIAQSTLDMKDDCVEWRTPQRAGNCYYKSVLECLRYQLRLEGLSKKLVKHFFFTVRREYVEMCVLDLECVSNVKAAPADISTNGDSKTSDNTGGTVTGATLSPLHDPSDLPMLRLGTQQLAYTARKECKSGRLTGRELRDIYQLINKIEKKMITLGYEVDYHSDTIPTLLSNTTDTMFTPLISSLLFPYFESFHHNSDRDKKQILLLAGEKTTPALAPTVDYSTFPATRVINLKEAIDAINAAILLCTQTMTGLTGAYTRLALIQQLINDVLPLPKPRDLQAQCIWSITPITFKQQQEIIHSLLRLCRIYITSMFSLDFPASFSSAYRIIPMAALLTIADKIIRTQPNDVVNPITSVYNGIDDSHRYGISLANGAGVELAVLTSQMEIITPALALCRGHILEYWHDIEKRVNKKIFQYRNSALHQTANYTNEDPTLQLVRDICNEAGYVIDKRGYGTRELSEIESVTKWLYADEEGLYGVSHAKQLPALAKEHPEFAHWRDLIFLYKLSLVPMRTTCRVVSVGRWHERDARIYWSYQGIPSSNAMVFVYAKAFDRKEMLTIQSRNIKSPADPSTHMKLQTGPSGTNAFGGLFSLPGLMMPMMNNTNNNNNEEKKGLSEDDIIHAINPPTFNGILSIEHSERLLAILTTPYIRIPLLLDFFSNKDNIDLLFHHQLQRILSCALFESGTWNSAVYDAGVLTTVPAVAGRLGSPFGLLINELLHSSTSTLSPLITLVHHAMALDMGVYSITSAVQLLLFLSKIVVRIESYVRFCLKLINESQVTSSIINTHQLQHYHKQLLIIIQDNLFPLLSLYKTQVQSDIPHAVLLHSHLALLAHSALYETSISNDDIINYIGSYCYVQTWHSMGIGIGKTLQYENEMEEENTSSSNAPTAPLTGTDDILTQFAASFQNTREESKLKQARLNELKEQTKAAKPAIPEMELFIVQQQIRKNLLNTIKTKDLSENTNYNSPQSLNRILKNVVKVVHSEEMISPTNKNSNNNDNKLWKSIDTGRYLTIDNNTELNLQTGQLSSHSSSIHPIDDRIARMEDYILLFGNTPQHASLLDSYTYLSIYSMFGHPYELYYWLAADKYEAVVGLPTVNSNRGSTDINDANYKDGTSITTGGEWKCLTKDCKQENPNTAEKCIKCNAYKPMMSEVERKGVEYEGVTYTRRYGSTALPPEESWIVDIIEEVLIEMYGDKREFLNYSLFLPTTPLLPTATSVTLMCQDTSEWKQVIISRIHMLLEVYSFYFHGRKSYRTLIYTSNARFSLRSFTPKLYEGSGILAGRLRPWGQYTRHQAGQMDSVNRLDDTLVIERTIGETKQSFVPSVCLEGIVPAVLLENYFFWHTEEDENLHTHCRIIGVPREKGSQKWKYGLLLESIHEKSAGTGMWGATIKQAQLKLDESGVLSNKDNDSVDNVSEEKRDLVLLHLLAHSAPTDPLYRLTLLLTRIENLSHILVWADSNTLELVSIELPRLSLTFIPKLDPNSNVIRLYSHDHAGYYLTDYRDETLLKLLSPLPFSLLLENERHDLRLLMLNAPLYRPRVFTCPFTTELICDRTNTNWQNTVKTRYYVYTVHISHTFLLAETLSSSLYLLTLYLLHREYLPAYRLCETCAIDTTLSSEETYALSMMQRALNDQTPDSHAVRLKLALAVSYSEVELGWKNEETNEKWSLATEYSNYIKKVMHVSEACKLSMEEELALSELCKDAKGKYEERDVENRVNYLRHIPSPPVENGVRADLLLTPFRREGIKNSWFEWESQVVQFFSKPWSAGLWHATVCYERPKESSCIGSKLHTLIGDSINDTMVGSQHKLGFLFLYELLTGAIEIRLSPQHPDCSFTLGKLLTTFAYCRMTDYGDRVRASSGYLPYAVNAVLSSYYFPTPNNPNLIKISIPTSSFPPLPKLPYGPSDAAALEKGVVVQRSNTIAGSFFQTTAVYMGGFVQFCREWQTQHTHTPAQILPEGVVSVIVKGWTVSSPTDTACNHREMTGFTLFNGCGVEEAEVEKLCTTPLSSIKLDRFIQTSNRMKEETPPLNHLPFDLSAHSTARSTVAKNMLRRMDIDMEEYATQITNAAIYEIQGITEKDGWDIVYNKLKDLVSALSVLRDRDSEYVRSGQILLEQLANHIPHTESPLAASLNESKEEAEDEVDLPLATSRYLHLLTRYTQLHLTLTLDYLTAILLSTQAVKDIQRINPFLSLEQIDIVLYHTSAVLLRCNRLGLIDRCKADALAAMRMIKEREMVKSEEEKRMLVQQISIQTRALTEGLTMKRHYMKKSKAKDSDSSALPFVYDPRFLVFEYIFNILLRSMQVDLVNSFLASVSLGNESGIVQQMIMGAGKTTVVAPLLCLMLADGSQLITQVVPASLLPMSRAILRSRFTSLLPKRILTFDFDRSYKDDPALVAKLFSKLEVARKGKGVVVTTGTSIKSLFLKYIELLHLLSTADFNSLTPEEETKLSTQSIVSDRLARILMLFRTGVLIMDEVDLLLHPLKSELNFPIGPRLPLQPAPDRWLLALHMNDALFYQSSHYLSLSALHDVKEAKEILLDIENALTAGKEQQLIQSSPHLLLLSESYYHHHIKPLLAQWALLFLRSKGIGRTYNTELLIYLCKGPSNTQVNDVVVNHVSSSQMVLLNLSVDWLNSYGPHVWKKINRVSYGLLHQNDEDDKIDTSSHYTRQLVAVPFLAKDVPSRSSEFSHPDILISLTILAFRIEGLRMSDIRSVISSLKKSASEEMGPEHLRPSALLFDNWIKQARFIKTEVESAKILPLSKLQLNDKVQLRSLHSLLRRVPDVITHYLISYIFPTTLQNQLINLSASGQELGGSLLVKRRLGFSGTPSDLLPLELGSCVYERGSDGHVMSVLCDKNVVTVTLIDSRWSVYSLLLSIAKLAKSMHWYALIDTGALITGIENESVASFLLANGLEGYEGVVYLNSDDDAMILLRSSPIPIPLSQSGIATNRRFTFYDQIHTTGIDMKHTANACAVVTLGKDMTFRDYAQGTFRMRQIGIGQTIHLFIIPEVLKLIERELQLNGKSKKTNLNVRDDLPRHVCAWLCVNSMRSETIQFYQLAQQNLNNVWRKQAYHTLLISSLNLQSPIAPSNSLVPRHKRLNLKHSSLAGHSSEYHSHLTSLLTSLDLFRHPLNFSISNIIPKAPSFFHQLKVSIAAHVSFLQHNWQLEAIASVLNSVVEAETGSVVPEEVSSAGYDREMINEQEREQEKEKEKEVLRDPRANRSDEEHVIWKIDSLTRTLPFTVKPYTYTQTVNHHPFYAASSLRLAECPQDPLTTPSNVLVSHNYYKQGWSINPQGHRRLKNVMIVLEWVLQTKELADTEKRNDSALDSPDEQLRRLFEMLDTEKKGKLDGMIRSQVASLLDIPLSDVPAALDYSAFVQLAGYSNNSASSRYLPEALAIKSSSSPFLSSNRHFVVVPLVEAETLRRSIHTDQPIFSKVDQDGKLVPGGNVSIALWSLGGQLIDYTPGYVPGSSNQQALSFQSLRFMNNDLFYSEGELISLLRGIKDTPLSSRLTFFSRALTCRHRDRRTFMNTPVSTAMAIKTATEYIFLRSLRLVLFQRIKSEGWSLLTAFSVFDIQNQGFLTEDEVWSGMQWFKLNVTVSEVKQFIRLADLDKNGSQLRDITYINNTFENDFVPNNNCFFFCVCRKLDFSEFAAVFHEFLVDGAGIESASTAPQQLTDKIRAEVDPAEEETEEQDRLPAKLKEESKEELKEERKDGLELPRSIRSSSLSPSHAQMPLIKIPSQLNEEKEEKRPAIEYVVLPSSAAPSSTLPPSLPPSTSASASPMKKICVSCTFKNDPTRTICEMCSSLLPLHAVNTAAETTVSPPAPFNLMSLLAAGRAGSSWTCSVCTLINPPTSQTCQACGTAKK